MTIVAQNRKARYNFSFLELFESGIELKGSEIKSLRDVINGESIKRVMDKIFGEETTHFSFAWLRAMVQGKASPLHIDHPYMNLSLIHI